MFLNYKFELNYFEHVSFPDEIKEDTSIQPSSQQMFRYQSFLNSIDQPLKDSYQNHDFGTLDAIFQKIDSDFIPDPSIGELFEYLELHRLILNLLQFEEWTNNASIWRVLCHITYFCSKETNSFLIENKIVEIIKNTIHSDNVDNIICSFICLGNLIASTGDTYQELILNLITFDDVTCYFNQHVLPSISTLFLLTNIVHFYHIIPSTAFPGNLLEALFQNDNWRYNFFLFRTINCFIEMMNVDCNISIIFYQDISSLLDTEYEPLSIFRFLYSLFKNKHYSADIKNPILLFFAKNVEIQKSLMKMNPDRQEIFCGNINFIFDSIFQNDKCIRIGIEDDKIDLRLILALLANSIEIKAKFENFIELTELMKIFNISLKLEKSHDNFKIKESILKLILVIIENYHANLELMRFDNMRIASNLVESLGYGNKLRILNDIILLIEAFANSPESEEIKNKFIEFEIEEQLDELQNDEPEIAGKAAILKNILLLNVEE